RLRTGTMRAPPAMRMGRPWARTFASSPGARSAGALPSRGALTDLRREENSMVGLRGGFRLFSVRGIPIRVHYSFLLLLPLLALSFARVFETAERMSRIPPERIAGASLAWGSFVAVALFAAVVLHELAHALYAIAHGGKVRSIT